MVRLCSVSISPQSRHVSRAMAICFILSNTVCKASWTRWYVSALCYNVHALWSRYAALCSFANINRSLSTDTVRGFCTLFDGEGFTLLAVHLWQVKPRPAGQSKWHEAWWKKNPRPSGQKWILIQFRGFFFHHASCHFLWPTSHGKRACKITSIISKPSPLKQMRKTIKVSVERERSY